MTKLLVGLLIFVPALVFASGESELHRLKAKKFADIKEWALAADEAKAAVKSDPSDVDAWLVLGISRERLGQATDAAEAYRKYLALNPPVDSAKAVRERLATLEFRNEVKTTQENRASMEDYGPGSIGIGLGYSPVFKPKSADELGGGVSRSIDINFYLKKFFFGLRFGSGDVAASVQAPVKGTQTEAAAIFSSVAISSQSFFTVELGGLIPLNEPYQSLGPVELFIPAQGGISFNNLSSTGTGRSFTGGSFDLATGLGATVYTKTFVNFQLTALYHLGLPVLDPKESETKVAVKKTNGEALSSSSGGFELKLELKLLFPGGV